MEFEQFDDVDIPEEQKNLPIPPNRPVLEDLRGIRKYPIPTYPLFIGREKRSSICLPFPSISRKHAKIFEREGKFYIQDMGSINGTFVNEKRILDPVELKEGDRVKVGITQKFPKGTREFLFRMHMSEEEKKEREKIEERDRILQEVGVLSGLASERKKIALRHCIFKVAKKDFISTVFRGEEMKRVPLVQLAPAQNTLDFLHLSPYKVKDNVLFSLEHPRLPEPLKILLRIVGVEESPRGVFYHKGVIVKLSDKQKVLYETLIDESERICYLTSTLQAVEKNEAPQES